ncbi:hypothetical protein J3459_022519 [Metarhizium acridum]|nr:hypothetical protein J3459_022519 [Metarhizium acridum]
MAARKKFLPGSEKARLKCLSLPLPTPTAFIQFVGKTKAHPKQPPVCIMEGGDSAGGEKLKCCSCQAHTYRRAAVDHDCLVFPVVGRIWGSKNLGIRSDIISLSNRSTRCEGVSCDGSWDSPMDGIRAHLQLQCSSPIKLPAAFPVSNVHSPTTARTLRPAAGHARLSPQL